MIGTTILFSHNRLIEFLGRDSRLQKIVIDAAKFWPVRDMVIGSILRTQAEDAELGGSGIHPAGRAVDILGADLGVNPKIAWENLAAVASAVNALWVYDPERPTMTCCVATPHGTGPHLHCQVHSNTRRREIPDALHV